MASWSTPMVKVAPAGPASGYPCGSCAQRPPGFAEEPLRNPPDRVVGHRPNFPVAQALVEGLRPRVKRGHHEKDIGPASEDLSFGVGHQICADALSSDVRCHADPADVATMVKGAIQPKPDEANDLPPAVRDCELASLTHPAPTPVGGGEHLPEQTARPRQGDVIE